MYRLNSETLEAVPEEAWYNGFGRENRTRNKTNNVTITTQKETTTCQDRSL